MRHRQSVSRSKTKKPPLSGASDEPKTDALKRFEENLGLLTAFLNRFHPTDLQRSGKVLGRVIERFKDDPENVAPLTRAANKVSAAVQEYLSASRLSHEWLGVMLVTFTEVYLEDGLISLSALNPKLIKDAPPIDHHRILETESLDELRHEVRQRWAHQKVEGGPRKFVRRLKDMGARGYDEKDIFRIEHLWDTRNLIVHSRGIVDVAYIKKYNHLQTGVHVKVNLAQLEWWLPAMKGFVECTDRFFLNYGLKLGVGGTRYTRKSPSKLTQTR
jgi:hypothetical protein